MTAARVLLLSGPNLEMLGRRDPSVYGTATLEDHVSAATMAATEVGLELEHVQSNHEGELVDAVNRAIAAGVDALVVNAGALSHYGWSLHDALASFTGPVIEVHISNPGAREAWRHSSVIAPVATGTIAGLKGHGYVLAVHAVARLLEDPS